MLHALTNNIARTFRKVNNFTAEIAISSKNSQNTTDFQYFLKLSSLQAKYTVFHSFPISVIETYLVFMKSYIREIFSVTFLAEPILETGIVNSSIVEMYTTISLGNLSSDNLTFFQFKIVTFRDLFGTVSFVATAPGSPTPTLI